MCIGQIEDILIVIRYGNNEGLYDVKGYKIESQVRVSSQSI